jgi:poly(hydroxyalkanoate) depolymerase family esterase
VRKRHEETSAYGDGVPNLLSRSMEWIRRFFRREPAPGYWKEGSTFAFAGFIRFRPWVLPRRHYRLYVPLGYTRWRRAPLLVMIHGCKQTAAELAQGTRITALADAHGALVLMPHQSDAANPYRCWNWFDARTVAGKGEAAIVAKMIRSVAASWRADPARIMVAGMSAGGALAAILGLRYPKLVRAVATHSGIACGAAASAYTVLTAMKRGPETDVAQIAREARTSADIVVPLLAIQGAVDDVVAARHAWALARQYLVLNGVAVPDGGATTVPPPDFDARDATAAAHVAHTREWRRDGRPLVRLVEIDWLGHAWSGGDPALPFNEGAPPDATAMIGEWLAALPR